MRRWSPSRSPAIRIPPRIASRRRWRRRPRCSARIPGLFIGEVGDASSTKAVDKAISDDFHKAEVTSLPITLIILVLAFGSLVAAGVPLLLGLHRGSCGARPDRAAQPPCARQLGGHLGDPVHRVGGGHRLFALLRAQRTRGARPRAHARRGPAGSGGDLRSGGADLWSHGDGRDDGDVPDGLADLHLVRDRDRARGRDRAGRLADRAAGRARQARRPGRPGAGPRPGPAARRERRVPVLGARSSARCCGDPCSGAAAATALLVALAVPAFSLHTVESGLRGSHKTSP